LSVLLTTNPGSDAAANKIRSFRSSIDTVYFS